MIFASHSRLSEPIKVRRARITVGRTVFPDLLVRSAVP